jgi:hypothetical protein
VDRGTLLHTLEMALGDKVPQFPNYELLHFALNASFLVLNFCNPQLYDGINLEEPIGYPAHTRLISPSVSPSIHLSIRLSVRLSGTRKNVDFECGN